MGTACLLSLRLKPLMDSSMNPAPIDSSATDSENSAHLSDQTTAEIVH